MVCQMHRMMAMEIETQQHAKRYDWDRPIPLPTDWMGRRRGKRA